jgi:DNA-3-methyladenine glycosylase II
MSYFEYGELEKNHLMKADKTMEVLIEKLGHIERPVEPDLFGALVSSIISQQISTRAAETIKGRLLELIGQISSDSILGITIEELRACGLSGRKAEYIKNAALEIEEGSLDLNALKEMSDDEVISVLTSIKGIGIWTAEMLLIFSLQRRDVLSYLDLGIRRGIMRAYGFDELSREEFEKIRVKMSPYGSVASLYFWKLAGLDEWESLELR